VQTCGRKTTKSSSRYAHRTRCAAPRGPGPPAICSYPLWRRAKPQAPALSPKN
jgi:hypothetical protein